MFLYHIRGFNYTSFKELCKFHRKKSRQLLKTSNSSFADGNRIIIFELYFQYSDFNKEDINLIIDCLNSNYSSDLIRTILFGIYQNYNDISILDLNLKIKLKKSFQDYYYRTDNVSAQREIFDFLEYDLQ